MSSENDIYRDEVKRDMELHRRATPVPQKLRANIEIVLNLSKEKEWYHTPTGSHSATQARTGDVRPPAGVNFVPRQEAPTTGSTERPTNYNPSPATRRGLATTLAAKRHTARQPTPDLKSSSDHQSRSGIPGGCRTGRPSLSPTPRCRSTCPGRTRT